MTPRFTLLGDVLVDITALVSEPLNHASDTAAQISVQPGGSAMNTACWLAFDGGEASVIGAVGDDAFGDMIRAHLRRLGVNDALVTVSGEATGACIVIVDEHGERTMLPDPGANCAYAASSLPADAFPPGGHFHLSGYTLMNPKTSHVGRAALQRARASSMTVSLDPSSAAPLSREPQALLEVLDQVDVLLANQAEAAVLTGHDDVPSALEALAQLVPTVVLKLGGAGSLARRGSEYATTAAVAARVVDTTGAGDAFAAGFLPAWATGVDLATCLGRAAESAARAVARVGAGPG